MMAGLLIDRGVQIAPLGVAIYFNIPAILIIVLCLGVLVGAINGVLITRFNVAPFIATLGTLYVARGAAQLSNNGATFPNLGRKSGTWEHRIPDSWRWEHPRDSDRHLDHDPLRGRSGAFVAGKTPFGRQVYAVGGNERAAELSGIYVNRIKMAVYMICGLCGAMTGLITASQLVAAHPATGESYELNAIAAVVLGGTSLAGGRGTIWGTIVGALVIGVLTNGLVLLGVQEFWKKVITGLVIILAVVLDQLQETPPTASGSQTRMNLHFPRWQFPSSWSILIPIKKTPTSKTIPIHPPSANPRRKYYRPLPCISPRDSDASLSCYGVRWHCSRRGNHSAARGRRKEADRDHRALARESVFQGPRRCGRRESEIARLRDT